MRVVRAVHVLVAAALVGAVPSAVVARLPEARTPSAAAAPLSVQGGSLRADADRPAPPAHPAATEPVAESLPNAAPVDQPVPGQAVTDQGVTGQAVTDQTGTTPSDGLSVAERNNRVATPRPSMEETLGTRRPPPPVVIRNDPPPPPTPAPEPEPVPPAP
ncbi:hypothetical protein [Saccharothrix sp. HUAS TT1]|uniref:hypothetical protein n=1 Tax=unclassified Saccharothrix TaxID=2593673 RepID=UPI00345BF474